MFEPTDLYTAVHASQVWAELARRGITTLTIPFDGGGDSGQLEDAIDQAGNVVDLDELCDGLGLPRHQWNGNFVEVACYSELPGGWEINEGSQGSFTFDVATKAVTLDFEWGEEWDEEPEVPEP